MSLLPVLLRSRKNVFKFSRSITTTQIRHGDQRTLMWLKKIQSQYQVEDGVPIWLRAGLRDRILYLATVVGCFIGICGVLHTIYLNARPNSWKDDICE